MTEEQAETLKERLDAEDAPLFFGGFGHGPDHGHLGHVATLETAASYLELTEAELRSQLAGGKSLAEIAEAEGKSVDGLVRTLVDSARTKLDQAVEDGRLTKAQADEIKGGLEERIRELVDRDPGSRRGFMEPRFRHGFGAFHDGHGLPEPARLEPAHPTRGKRSADGRPPLVRLAVRISLPRELGYLVRGIASPKCGITRRGGEGKGTARLSSGGRAVGLDPHRSSRPDPSPTSRATDLRGVPVLPARVPADEHVRRDEESDTLEERSVGAAVDPQLTD